eukprot:gene4577-4831_t
MQRIQIHQAATHVPGEAGADVVPRPLDDLVSQLAALKTLEQRSELLETCKYDDKYRCIFPEAHMQPGTPRASDDSTLPPAKTELTCASDQASHHGPAVTCQVFPAQEEVTTDPLRSFEAVISLQATKEVLKPTNTSLVTVIDKSGSMSGSKMRLVKATIDFLAQELSSEDAFGLVTYSNSEHVADAADAVPTVGGTRRVRSVFLCTDGQPNELAALADDPVSIHAFGFGADHDSKLLQAIAEAGSGMYYYIEDDSQIPEAFGDALGGLFSVVASNVNVSISVVSDGGQDQAPSTKILQVKSGGVVRVAPEPDNGYAQATICFNDLFAEESRELLLELELEAAPKAIDVSSPLLKVDVTFCDPNTGCVTSSTHFLEVKRCDKPKDQQCNNMVQAARARYRTAEAVQCAGELTKKRDYKSAMKLLQQAQDAVAKHGAGGEEQAHLQELATCMDSISELRRSKKPWLANTTSVRMEAASKSMQHQRSTFVGLTSACEHPAPTSLAAAPRVAAFASAPAHALPPCQNNPLSQLEEGLAACATLKLPSWSTSNSVRQHMSYSAAQFVSKMNTMPAANVDQNAKQ